MADTAVIYEVTLAVDPAILGEFDAWLADHVQAMLRLPGFRAARLLQEPPNAHPARITRVVQYTLTSQEQLDAYFREHAPRMRADGIARFGDRFDASRRVFPTDNAPPPTIAPDAGLRCLNCGTPLAGKYCVECGQPNHTYVAPLWETIEEFFGNHFGFDTRFFHSIVPLLLRPGFLSREYCAGRRERYIKPLRLYLFSSILFFFCAAWLGPNLLGTPPVASQAERTQTRHKLQDALDQIKKNPELSADQKAEIAVAMQARLDALDGKNIATDTLVPKKESSAGKHSFSQRLNEKLGKIQADRQGFINELLYHTVPKAMFVFLPLVALLLKLFYIRHKHLYMEHLIFTLHCHALFFIAALAGVIIAAFAKHYAWPASVMDYVGGAIRWYLAVYLFLALRNFYQQSWTKTLVKFCLMFIGYFVLAVLGFLAALAVAFAEI